MDHRHHPRAAFLLQLEKNLLRSKKKLTENSQQSMSEILNEFPSVANEMGSVLVFLTTLFDVPAPKSVANLSISNGDSDLRFESANDSYGAIVRTTPCPQTPDLSPRNKGTYLYGSMELNDVMEKLILVCAELNQPFLETVLDHLEKNFAKPRLRRLFLEPRRNSNSPMNNTSFQSEDESNSPRKSRFAHARESKSCQMPTFSLTRRCVRMAVRYKAYDTIALLVAKPYFLCGDDCGSVAGDPFNLATFLELVKDKPHFTKVARRVIEGYRGNGILKEIINYTRWSKELRANIAQIYLNALPDIINAEDLIVAIQFEMLPIAMKIQALHVEISREHEHSFSRTLIHSFKKSTHLGEKLYLAKTFFLHLNYDGAKELMNSEIKLSFAQNPIKEAVHFYEMLGLIGKSFSALKIKADERAEELEQLILKFGEDIDQGMLKALMLDRDFEGRTTIKVIHELQLVTFFPKLEPIIDELWKSHHERKGSLFQTSVSYHILCKSSLRHPMPVDPFKWDPRSKAKNHMFRLAIWKASPMVRFFSESVYILLLTLFMQFVLVEMQLLVKDLDQNQFAKLDALQTNDPQLHYQIAEEIKLLMKWFLLLEETLALFAIFLIQPFFDFWGQLPLKKPFNFTKVTYLLDVLSVTAFSYYFYQTYKLLQKTQQDDGSLEYRIELEELFRSIYLANLQLFDAMLGIGIMSLWLRVLLIFRGSEFLGPFLKVIQKLAKDIATFFLLYVIVLVSFASVGNLAFFHSDSYSNLFDAFMTLFSASVGGFDFQTIGSIFGKLFLALFLVISLIMLFNLLIAILSSTYASYEKKGRGLYLHEVLGLWENVQSGGHRGFLMMHNFPSHVLVLPFLPCFLCTRSDRSKERLDNFLQNIQFIAVLILHILFYLPVALLCLPFAYLKLVMHSILSVTKFRAGAYRRRCFLLWINIITGPVILAARIIIDLGFMIHDDFQLTHTREVPKFEGLALRSDTLGNLMEIFEERINIKLPFQSVLVRDLLLVLRQRMNVQLTFSDIANMVYAFSRKNDTKDAIFLLHENKNSQALEQFKRIKDYLLQNSYRASNNQFRIYPMIFLRVIQEHFDKQAAGKLPLNKSFLSIRSSKRGPRIEVHQPKILKHHTAPQHVQDWHDMSDLSDLSILYPQAREEAREERRRERREELSYFSSELGSLFGAPSEEQTMNFLVQLPPLAISHFAHIEATTKNLEEEEPLGLPDVDSVLDRKITRMEENIQRLLSPNKSESSFLNF